MAVNYTSLFETAGTHMEQLERFATTYTGLASYESAMETQYNANSHLHLYEPAHANLQAMRGSVETFHLQLKSIIDGIFTDKEIVLDELPGLTTSNISDVLKEMYRDMVDNSQTILESTVTVGSVTKDHQNTNAGDLVTDTTLDGYNAPGSRYPANPEYLGITSELVSNSDDVVVECTSDSVADAGASIGSESFIITGQPTSTSQWSYESVKGSGGSTAITPVDGTTVLTNGTFEAWTGSEPDSWTTTDSGSILTKETSDTYYGSAAGLVTGDGSSDVTMTQEITTSVDPLRRYCVVLRYKGQAGISAGELKVYLSGTGYTTAGSDEISLNSAALAAATSWTYSHFFVNIPKDIPSDAVINIEINNLSNTHTVRFDAAAMAPAVYHDGVAYAIINNQTQVIKGDRYTLSNSNDDAGSIQTYMRRLYGIQLPSDASPSIPDGVAEA